MAFDPFAQQLVQLRQEIAFTPNDRATMTVMKRYDTGILRPLELAPVIVDSSGSAPSGFSYGYALYLHDLCNITH